MKKKLKIKVSYSKPAIEDSPEKAADNQRFSLKKQPRINVSHEYTTDIQYF